uniref:Remorin C-terminal domain-containing protein n=1 Tax=Cucumis melo TaxID=3656 RepID=A0A9I9CM76_CUCME
MTEISDSAEKVDAAKDRDIALARVEWEKKMALIKAWEESEKIKAENKAYKRLSAVESWENTRKASIEAQLMKIEEKMEKKKAEYAEQMKNKIVGIHKEGEEKKATIEAERKEQCLKVEETAEKYRTSGLYQFAVFYPMITYVICTDSVQNGSVNHSGEWSEESSCEMDYTVKNQVGILCKQIMVHGRNTVRYRNEYQSLY